eukprot:COSAG01_NODE_8926_length_2612_cov_1.803422_2_plen_310_part_00
MLVTVMLASLGAASAQSHTPPTQLRCDTRQELATQLDFVDSLCCSSSASAQNLGGGQPCLNAFLPLPARSCGPPGCARAVQQVADLCGPVLRRLPSMKSVSQALDQAQRMCATETQLSAQAAQSLAEQTTPIMGGRLQRYDTRAQLANQLRQRRHVVVTSQIVRRVAACGSVWGIGTGTIVGAGPGSHPPARGLNTLVLEAPRGWQVTLHVGAAYLPQPSQSVSGDRYFVYDGTTPARASRLNPLPSTPPTNFTSHGRALTIQMTSEYAKRLPELFEATVSCACVVCVQSCANPRTSTCVSVRVMLRTG